ncbi:hypothetical protein PMIN06_002547 [Paraphaeosphaeria minitans]|uniref:Uncharacterized protein n=1 Tax=Paraphaeosphaeria minitans TaxID=565426 RepID=A0A9P6GHV9_9PLEO|nr:hypothetical protein PMIN01_05922 [Paraphaeosphaeria minitans]
MVPSYTGEPRGMNPSQKGHMRAHIKQRNISSTSLEGMELPVRSFESFIQTAPPNPSETDKALPLTPAPWNRAKSGGERIPKPPSAGIPLASRDRTSKIAFWRAPAEWYNDNASVKSAHATPSPPATPAPRTFSPLLPETSPGSLGMAEPTTWPNPGVPPTNRLLPIYERSNGNSDMGTPGSPPQSPLPATPLLSNRSIDNVLPPVHRRVNTFPSKDEVATDRVQELPRTGSNQEKAYASLGLDSPLPKSPYESESNQLGRERADWQYLRGKKLRALYKGSPLHDDSWEDEDMDDKTRELSFSQDYHDLLADQYQEMNVRVQEVLSTGGAQQVHEAQLAEPTRSALPNHRDLVPRPLSWHRSTGPSTPGGQSHDGNGERASSPGKKSRHKRISSFIPHRSGSSEPNEDEPTKTERRPSGSKLTPESEADKNQEDDLRFSRFFPSSRPIKFGKKHKKTEAAKAPSVPSPPPQPNHLVRLPGGLTVERTHSRSPVPKSDVLSDKSPTSTHTRGSSQFGSDYSPTTSNPRSSYNSNKSPPTANIPIAMRSAFRTSGGFSYPRRSSTGHPTAQEPLPPLPPPPPPPPPLIMPYSPPQSPPLSPRTLVHLREENKQAEHRHRPNFIEKAKEARRRRLTEARQDKLKRSIRVLGPTDPGISQAGYVKSEGRFERSDSDLGGRLPGYLVRGPA